LRAIGCERVLVMYSRRRTGTRPADAGISITAATGSRAIPITMGCPTIATATHTTRIDTDLAFGPTNAGVNAPAFFLGASVKSRFDQALSAHRRA
jgi:hypothetical protein